MYEKANSNTDAKSQEELVVRYAPLVKRIAYHLMARMPPMVLVDDLIQAGMIGLLDACRNYDPQQGASFETYAGIRIRGAMLDELRRNDWAPKSVHRKIREMTHAIRDIESRTGRDARDEEIMAALGLDQKEFFKILREANMFRMTNFEDLGIDEEAISNGMVAPERNPLEALQDEDFKHGLAHAIAALPERERTIITLYYDAELNLREIGGVLGVSESRTSQLLSQALIRLRARMTNWVSQ
jgi:RNA polymerase sigma factor for flagellar operon FliA